MTATYSATAVSPDGMCADRDGMCADRDGNLWIAAGGGRVEKRHPGRRAARGPRGRAANTTSVAFAEPGLDITSATQGLDTVSGNDGRVLTARVDAAGLPTPYWNPAL